MSGPLPLIVIGAGGHGRETVSLVRDLESANPDTWDLRGVIADECPDCALLDALGTAWLGTTSRLAELEAGVSVAIGDGSTRRRLQELAAGTRCQPVTLIHPSASIGTDIEMGAGCYVGALSVLTTHIRLGEGVQVNVGCTISHDVALGDFATLAPGVRIAGGATVGDSATVFAGATVIPGVTIGAASVVGAGSVVLADVPAGETVVGVPARPLGRAQPRRFQ